MADRATVLSDVAASLGAHGAELVRVVTEEEDRAKAAERESYRAKYEVALNDHKTRRARAEEDARWHGEAEKQLTELLRGLSASPGSTGSPPPPPPLRDPLPQPPASEHGFRKAVVEEMVETWHDALDRSNAEALNLLECMLRNIPGVERIGEKGQTTTFNPALHESSDFYDTGTAVVILFPGWSLQGEMAPYVVRKAVVGTT